MLAEVGCSSFGSISGREIKYFWSAGIDMNCDRNWDLVFLIGGMLICGTSSGQSVVNHARSVQCTEVPVMVVTASVKKTKKLVHFAADFLLRDW